jgi:anti-sigma B factor antagonist
MRGMKLRAYTRVDSGVAVIELEGAITLGNGLDLLREMVTRALDEGFKGILLDLENVMNIDSAGLGELVSLSALADARGGDVKLVHLQKKVRGLLQITKLITIFEAFEDERTAIRSFQRVNAAPA